MYEFKLPDVGEGIHEAEVLQWLVNVGAPVALDQPMLEIQTDKAIVEIPSPVAGTIAEIRAEPGSMAQVGEVLVTIVPADGQDIDEITTPGEIEHQAAAKSASAIKAPGIPGPGRRILAAPAVRKLALELGVDLAQVTGSGPAGRILPEDVHDAKQIEPEVPPAVPPQPVPKHEVVTPPSPAARVPAPSTAVPTLVAGDHKPQESIQEEPLKGLRRRIAERMEQAWQIPHVTSFEEVEATNLVALRQHLKPEAEQRGIRLTFLPFIVKATVQTLKEHPYFNASLDMEQQKILLRRYYHIGVATAVEDGLLVPVIRHADQLNLLQIAAELSRLSELAQQRKLNLDELSGSTFTITNFGSFGAYQGTPIINSPEVAILGTGRIEEKPVAVQGQVEVRPVLPLALSYDHRLIDGAAAGAFLSRLKSLLADPNLLFLELV